MRSCLIITCAQNDFFEGGSVAVPGSLKLVSNINKLKERFDINVFVKDWHTKRDLSFKANGGTWSIHCVQDTEGAKIHNFIKLNDNDFIIHKGTKSRYESYSAFYNSKDTEELSQLNDLLKRENITDIYICGLPGEYDVFSTALDSHKFRYRTFIIRDCVYGYDKEKVDEKIKYLVNLGVKIVNFTDI